MPLRFSLADLVLLVCAAPVWLYVTLEVGKSNGWGGSPVGYFATPLVLTGITLALHQLASRRRNALLVCALAAPFVAYFALLLIAVWVRSG